MPYATFDSQGDLKTVHKSRCTSLVDPSSSSGVKEITDQQAETLIAIGVRLCANCINNQARIDHNQVVSQILAPHQQLILELREMGYDLRVYWQSPTHKQPFKVWPISLK